MFQYQAVVDTGTICNISSCIIPDVKYHSFHDFKLVQKEINKLYFTVDIQNPNYLTRGTFGSVSCRQDLEIPPEPSRPTEPDPTTPDFIGPPGPPGPTVHNLTFLSEFSHFSNT